MYADNISDSMDYAIKETNRRRDIQIQYNLENNIIPITIKKEIRDLISNEENLTNFDFTKDKKKLDKLIKEIEKEMLGAAKNLDFEKAAELRDILFEMKLSSKKDL